MDATGTELSVAQDRTIFSVLEKQIALLHIFLFDFAVIVADQLITVRS